MEKKIIILMSILLALSIGIFIIWRVFYNQEQWTGFYFPNVGDAAKITGINTGMNLEKYQSDVNEFKTLGECQDWAKAVRSLLLKTKKTTDVFLCSPGCKKADDGNLTCIKQLRTSTNSNQRAVFSTFE